MKIRFLSKLVALVATVFVSTSAYAVPMAPNTTYNIIPGTGHDYNVVLGTPNNSFAVLQFGNTVNGVFQVAYNLFLNAGSGSVVTGASTASSGLSSVVLSMNLNGGYLTTANGTLVTNITGGNFTSSANNLSLSGNDGSLGDVQGTGSSGSIAININNNGTPLLSAGFNTNYMNFGAGLPGYIISDAIDDFQNTMIGSIATNQFFHGWVISNSVNLLGFGNFEVRGDFHAALSSGPSVPEPTSIALLGLGALGAIRKRRQAKA